MSRNHGSVLLWGYAGLSGRICWICAVGAVAGHVLRYRILPLWFLCVLCGDVNSSTTEVTEDHRGRGLLDFHDFFFFGLAHLFHLFDFVVGELLDLVERALLFVFGDLLVFEGLLDGVVA